MVPVIQDMLSQQPWMVVGSSLALVTAIAYSQSSYHKLRHIPVAGGPSWPLLSYIGSKRFFRHAQEMFQEGYERYRGKLFKVAMMDRWLVVVTGRKLMQELAALPDEVMSFQLGANGFVESKYLFGESTTIHTYTTELIKRDLTRSLQTLFPDIYAEIVAAYDDYLPRTEEWTPISVHQVVMMVVARASNRVFVGLPLCRNEEYLKRCGIMYTVEAMRARATINKFPEFMKPLVGWLFSPLSAAMKQTLRMVGPEIEQRRKLILEYGVDYPDKPNDMLSWMMDYAFTASERALFTTHEIALRILLLNFAAIHTSANTFTHALYSLAANPDYIQPLRDEIEAVVETEGLSKISMLKMHKLDSFLRESTRVNTLTGLTLMRYAVQSYTFSDGTYIPAGTFLAAPSVPHHRDEDSYVNASHMDPLRFELRKEEDMARRHFTTTDFEYIPFGHGKHACPGRFFAGNELKAMMAHVLLNYDIRSEVEGVRPPNLHLGQTTLPNPSAKVLFRKRRSA